MKFLLKIPFSRVAIEQIKMLPRGTRKWVPEEKAWEINAEYIFSLSNLLAEVLPTISDELKTGEKYFKERAYANKIELERRRSFKDSQAETSNIEIPHPENIDYMGFQKAGIKFAFTHKNCLIADEMGLGKTIQAIGYINFDINIKSVLILCPATIKLNWKLELEKWLINNFSIGIADSKNPFPYTSIVIINYDIIAKFKKDIQKRTWDLLILDESHYLKNYATKRTKNVFGYRERGKREYTIEPIKANKKIALTGTPINNRPKEIFPIISNLAPETFDNFFSFGLEFCNGQQTRYGWDFSGSSNLEKLNRKLRETIMIRRLKKDVLKELPAKQRQVILIEDTDELRKVIEEEKRVFEKHKSIFDNIMSLFDYKKLPQREQTILFDEIATVRKNTAIAKIPYIIEHVENSIESSEKVILFVHHKEVMDSISSYFENICVKIDGRTKNEDRQKAIDDFQNKKEIKLFIGSITAAGVGITLTASSHVIFGELDWVPGNITQAEDRSHRYGQKNSVLIQHLIIQNSIDSKLIHTIMRKQTIINKALN